MKRLFVFIIVLSITFNWLPSNVFASVVPGEEAASSEYVEQKIEELFAERATLAHDYDSNAAEISKIDAELTNLGVETLTDDEFCALMKDVVGTQATLLTVTV